MTRNHNAQLPTVAVELKDGSTARLRPIRPGDEALIERGLAHMSLPSRVARFGTAIDHLSNTELSYLTDIDLVDHVAWGAMVGSEPAGTGRFIRTGEADSAEVAVAVVDSFQRKGLGRALLVALVASARARGISRLIFNVQPDNEFVVQMMQGVSTRFNDEIGLIEGEIDLRDIAPGESDQDYVELLDWYRAPPP